MDEYAAWTLMSAFFTSNAIFFLASIVAVWLGFRMSNNIFEGGNAPMIAKVLTTTYCLCVAFFMFGTLSQNTSLLVSFGAIFADMSATTEISAAASELSEFDSTIPTLVNIVFVASILIFQMAGVWMKKSDS